MREPEVAALLARHGASWALVDGLRADGVIERVDYAGERFFLTRGPAARSRGPATHETTVKP
jgi:hypothetical protein